MANSTVDFDRRRKLTLGVTIAAVIVLLGAIWMMIRPARNSPDVPGGTFWICQSCGNHFNVSTGDLHKFQAEHYGERYPCPKCKSTNVIRDEEAQRKSQGENPAAAESSPRR
jgi:DNA-directed RNA polymerase subunit M/transcription elongation factor TFIIS